MKRINLITFILLTAILVTCTDSTSDTEIDLDGHGPAIGISAGLDPTLVADDNFGGLAGASIRPDGSPNLWVNDPQQLPRLQIDSCGFLEGGLELGLNGASSFSANNSAEGLEAEAVNVFEVHDDNERITIEFKVYASANPMEDFVITSAEAGTGGADPFGVVPIGTLYVVDIDNSNGHETAIEIGWNLNSVLEGVPRTAGMDAVLMMNNIPSCGEGDDIFPFDPHSDYLFDIFDESVSFSNSRTVLLGRSTQSQVILSLELAIYAHAAGETVDGDGTVIDPAEHSSGYAEGLIEIKAVSVRP